MTLVSQVRAVEGGGELFRLLVESVRDYAIFMLDPGGRIATWNIGAERIKGYSAEEIVGQHFSVFYPEEDVRAGKCERALEVAADVGRYEDTGWRIRRDGSHFWANVIISAVRDGEDGLIGFSKVTRDLTERRIAEQEQAGRLAAEERFRLLVESVSDYAIFTLEPTGRIATWNVGAERIKGYTAAEIIGRHFSVFYPEEDVRSGKCERELAIATAEGRFEEEAWRLRRDGSRFWANVVISAVRDAEGALIGFAKVTRDLTDRQRADEERAARLVAEQANQAKDEFLAMLGHELRNPMAPILTALELMKLRGNPDFSREQEIIERQVNHMTHLVDDLLDVSRITRGKIELKRRALDIRDLLVKAIEVASPLLEQRRQHLDVHVPSGPILVEGDEARLTQVFANILTNAAKYTDAGGHVTIEVTQAAGEAIIAVTDDGIGIDAALLPRVFDLFEQGRQTLDRSSGGLGIGLALVRSLVEVHGGKVAAASAGTGKGSTFTVRLPALEPNGSATAPPIPPSTKQRRPARVLLVDDNDDARLLLVEALSAEGHQVRGAADAAETLDVIRSFRPDIAILDIGLPVMDGYELAVRLREELGAATPRLVALTGYGQHQDRARSQAAGFDVHLVKPIDVVKLLDTIGKLVPAAPAAPGK